MTSTPRTGTSLAKAAPEVGAAQIRFQQVAYPGSVDIVTRELLRILSGRLSRCTICRNLRLNVAIDRGFDEAAVKHLEDPAGSDLPARQQVVLRLTKAFLTDPEAFGAAEWAELRSYYSHEQVAELILDLVRFRPGSKLVVAAGLEPEDDELVYQ
jgi:alkylhydroperoxidase family enzyme